MNDSIINPFPHIDAFWRLCSRQLFENIVGKRRNCTKRAISPFATMFSTFCHRYSIQLWRFSFFWQNMFKVVCCRIAIWGKGLMNKVENNPFKLADTFWCLCSRQPLNTLLQTENLLIMCNFPLLLQSLFNKCFFSFIDTIHFLYLM